MSRRWAFCRSHVDAERDVSWRDVELTARGVRFRRPLVLDFGGIAKGYAVDCAIAALRSHGVESGQVNAGGDLRVFGPRSQPIHVRTGGPQGILLPLVEIADGAVATSAYGGDRRRVAGRRWATPLIDPRAGLPMMSTRTVSVIAPTCMLADALTKVVALRGRAAARVLRDYGASATVLSPAVGSVAMHASAGRRTSCRLGQAAMSRAHERAYHLLAERVRLGLSARRALYATIAATVLSGAWWLWIHFASTLFASRNDDLQRFAREAVALKVHGATAFAILLALGAMGAYHVRRGWGIGRNRGSGSMVVALCAILVVSGYALYYLVSEDNRTAVSVLHWALGLALVPLLIVHIALGRRSRRIAFMQRGSHRGA